jgi:uncharacterized protein (TIRG00374 family)
VQSNTTEIAPKSKNKWIEALKVIVPILLGIYLIFHFYNKLSESEKSDMFLAIKGANYWWLSLAAVLGLLSHWIRAVRWKHLLEPMGYKPKNLNSFFAVLIGYAANLLLPRLGEASRCASMAKYENIPFNKSFGTVIAERLIDVILLALVLGLTVFLQLKLIANSPEAQLFIEKFSEQTSNLSILFGIGGVLVFVIIFYWLYKWLNEKPFIKKLIDFAKGFLQGITSLLKMKNKALFLMQSLFIWVLYISMFWVCFFALPQTAEVAPAGILLAFVFGSFAVILVQGGIGVFPVAIMQALVYYNIPESAGMALGWLTWLVQTIGYLAFGLASLILMPVYNKKTLKNNEG